MRPRLASSALALLLSLVGGAAVSRFVGREAPDLPQRGSKPELALLTSLPLLFSERFGLDSGDSAARDRLERTYRLAPIPVADRASLSGQTLLLMAHPRAQPAEALVDLDEWVRRGGSLLLLADPALAWESQRPIGDALRPPPDFADTGLLGHWGLVLDGPDQTGPQTIRTSDGVITTMATGHLTSRSPACAVVDEGMIARCAIGRGRVTIIADADFIIASPTTANLDLLSSELARLVH